MSPRRGRLPLSCLNAPAARAIGEDRGLPCGEIILAIGYEENASAVAWQLDRVKSELKSAEFRIVEENQTAPFWSSLIEFQALAIGPAQFRRQLAPVVGSFVRRRARPVSLVGPGARRQRDCPSARPG